MAPKITNNINLIDTYDVKDAIGLNSSTATTLDPANIKRVSFHINNDNAALGFWLRQMAASTEPSAKKGRWISGKNGSNPFWDEPEFTTYTGEWSAITDSGNVDVYVTTAYRE